ncbi:MAG TPA: shikimate kinase, partial [Sphingobium sp.]|nr:shikimate kinase [Sphingobium sp.]
MQRNSKSVPSHLKRGPIVLVGMMGVGKSTVGRRLAARLGLSFVDADEEIEKAAGMTITEMFERYGEAYFRDGERRVIARLM